MKNELEQFSQLKSDIALFVAPTKGIRVTSFATSQTALEARNTLKSYLKQLEKKRTELVKPLNDQVKLINAYVGDIEAPLLEGEKHINAELSRFAAEQEKLRLAEIRKVEEAKREAERKAEEDRRRIESEFQAKKAAELKALENQQSLHDEAASLFGSSGPSAEDIEADRKRIEDDAERERIRIQTQLDQEAACRRLDQLGAEQDVNNTYRIKNTRKTWNCAVTDIDKVPREFLVITLNKVAVLAAARAGVKEIAGVRIWQDFSVGAGANGYVPEIALEAEAKRVRGE